MKTALLVSFIFAFVASLAAKPRQNAPYIHLSTSEVLYVQVIDNVYMSNFSEDDRFRRIEKAIEEVFAEINFPMAYQIESFGSKRTPANQPRLDIHIMKWGDNGLSEIEARFSASIRKDYDRNRLGVFYARDANVFGSYSRTMRVHDQVMQEAILKMVAELKTRLSVELFEEVEMDVGESDDLSEIE